MEIKVVTICGSMRYSKEMIKIAEKLELVNGYAVIQCIYNADFKKYEGIYVVNIDGYIGSSTKKEIKYAASLGKEIIYHEKIK